MSIKVPAKKRKRPSDKVPPMGQYRARVAAVADGEYEGEHVLTWTFTAEDREWSLPQDYDSAGLADVLVDFGFAGQDVDRSELVGREAMVEVKTFGGRTSARVVGVTAI